MQTNAGLLIPVQHFKGTKWPLAWWCICISASESGLSLQNYGAI